MERQPVKKKEEEETSGIKTTTGFESKTAKQVNSQQPNQDDSRLWNGNRKRLGETEWLLHSQAFWSPSVCSVVQPRADPLQRHWHAFEQDLLRLSSVGGKETAKVGDVGRVSGVQDSGDGNYKDVVWEQNSWPDNATVSLHNLPAKETVFEKDIRHLGVQTVNHRVGDTWWSQMK